jgi:hypothetical protein
MVEEDLAGDGKLRAHVAAPPQAPRRATVRVAEIGQGDGSV